MSAPDPTGEKEQVDWAAEVLLDAMLTMVEGKDDDDLVFLDGFLRSLAEHLGLNADFPEVEPMTAGQMRERWRAAKGRLAGGDGPGAEFGRDQEVASPWSEADHFGREVDRG